ncbi:hypothetical protein PUN28_008252 [Cardiocondyla obscurior]|uniref:Uncharacterized protein n=1 Tax=Cardiocondyla obscurior TaxID=286306 RepID=A0AAW2FYX2_9HYME
MMQTAMFVKRWHNAVFQHGSHPKTSISTEASSRENLKTRIMNLHKGAILGLQSKETAGTFTCKLLRLHLTLANTIGSDSWQMFDQVTQK